MIGLYSSFLWCFLDCYSPQSSMEIIIQSEVGNLYSLMGLHDSLFIFLGLQD